jgi:hypothetical protein
MGAALGTVEVLSDGSQTRRVMNQSTTVALRCRDTANTRSLLQNGRTLGVYTLMHEGSAGAFSRDMGAGIIQSVKPELLANGDSVISVQLRGMSSLLGKTLRWSPLGAETVYERFVSEVDGTAQTTASAPAGNTSLTLNDLTHAIVGYRARVPLSTGVKQLITINSTFNQQIIFTPALAASVASGVTVKFFDPSESTLVGPFTRTLQNGAPRNNGGCTLTNIDGIVVGDFISVPLAIGGAHVTRIEAIEPFGVENRLEFEARMPEDSIAAGGSVTIYKAEMNIDDSGDLTEGQRIVIDLNGGGQLETLIRKIRATTITLRDYAPAGASGGNAVSVYDYSLPATDDVAQLIAMRPDFVATIEGGSGGTAAGSSLLPRGDNLLQMLTAMAERNGEFWQDFPQSGVPRKRLSWRKTADATAGGTAPGGVHLTKPGPDTNMAAIYGNDFHGIVDRIAKDNQNGLVNRLYPVTADNRINLGYCSQDALAYAASLGFTVVVPDDLYVPHYIEDASGVTADGPLEVTETIGDISLDDTASAQELVAACDQLLFAAVNALLQYRSRTFYTIECQIERPLYPGYIVNVTNESGAEPAVDGSFYVIEVTDRLDGAGVPMSTVVVSDTLRARRTPANALARHDQAIVQSHRRSTTRVTTSAAGLVKTDSGGGGGVTDHGALTGLADNDHPQYLLAHYFNLHTADPAAHHEPVSLLNTGLQLQTGQVIGVRLAGVSALEIDNGLRLKESVAGLGLEIPPGGQILNIQLYEHSGMYVDGLGLRLAPGTIGAATGNTLNGMFHYHLVESSADARIVLERGRLLRSSAAGSVGVEDLYATRVRTGRILGEGTDISLEPAALKKVLLHAPLRFAAGFRIESDLDYDVTAAPGGRFVLDPAGDVVQVNANTSLQTAHHAGGYLGSGWQWTYDGDLDTRRIYADELHVSSLIYDAARVAVGRSLTAQSAAEIAEAFTIPPVGQTGQLTVFDAPGLSDLPVFEPLDWVVIQYADRSAGGLKLGLAWGTVESYVDLPGDRQRWTFRTRSASITGQQAGAGVEVHGLGKSGAGWHEVNAIDPQGPYSTIRTWRGSDPYTPGNIRTVTRHGRLSGVTGRQESGIYAGRAVSRRAILSDQRLEMHGSRVSLFQGDGASVRVFAVRVSVSPGSTVYTPVGDVSQTAVASSSGTMWQAVDDDPASPNTSDYILNETNGDGEAVLRLSGAGTWSGAGQVRINLAAQGYGFSADTVQLTAQVLRVDGRPLTGEQAIYTWSGNTYVGSEKFFDDVDTSATSADWVNARLVLRWEVTLSASREAIRLDPNVPSIGVGYPLPSGPDTGGNGFWVGLSDGQWMARLGESVGAGLRWTGSSLDLRNADNAPVISLPVSGSPYFANPIQLGPAGGIWQGTGGSFAAPLNGFRLWNDAGRGRLGVYDGAGRALTIGHDGLRVPASGAFAPGGIGELSFVDTSSGKRVAGVDAEQNIAGGSQTGYTATKLYVNDFANAEVAALQMGFSAIAGAAATLWSNGTVRVQAGGSSDAVATLRSYFDLDEGNTDEIVLHSHHVRVRNGPLSLEDTFTPLVWQAGDVNHGMTSLVHTSVYGAAGKRDSGSGGLRVAGYTESTVGLHLQGYVTSEDTVRSTGSRAAVSVEALRKSGSGAGALSSTANLFAVLNAGTARFFVTGNGNAYWDGSGSSFDEYDDVSLVRAADLAAAGNLDEQWSAWLNYNRADLEAAGLISVEDDTVMVNGSRMQRLLAGALWQLSERVRVVEERFHG